MTKGEALEIVYNGDLYDRKGYVDARGYEALAELDGVRLVAIESLTEGWVNKEKLIAKLKHLEQFNAAIPKWVYKVIEHEIADE